MWEIERKFKLDKKVFFENFNNINVVKKEIIEQSYINVNGNEIRVRKKEDLDGTFQYFLTIKTNGNLKRNEVELEIHSSKYEEIINGGFCIGETLKKFRYKIELEDSLVAEVDVYGKNLIGLMTVEVEFKSLEEASKFVAPAWFGKEVTKDDRYKNKNLIYRKKF